MARIQGNHKKWGNIKGWIAEGRTTEESYTYTEYNQQRTKVEEWYYKQKSKHVKNLEEKWR